MSRTNSASGDVLRRVDRRRPEPLWHQAEATIRAAIDRGAWSPGTQIPGEDQLTELLGVSRITVRHAMRNLEAAGLLRRERGRGTFVRESRLVAGTRALTSFTEELSASGLVVTSKVLSARRTPATAKTAEALEIEPRTPVTRIRRLRLGGGQPIGLQTAHLRIDRVPDLPTAALADGSLYALLRDRYGIVATAAEEVYRVGGVSRADADVLDLGRGAPVFLVERIARDEHGPFEFTTSTMRGDRYEIRSSLAPAR